MDTKRFTFSMGIKMFLAIGAFFLLIYLLNLGKYTELRFLNIFIIIFFSSRLAKKNVIEDDKIDYLQNLASVFTANVINVFLSIIAFAIFINFIDPDYLDEFKNGFFWGKAPGMVELCLALFFEGLAGSAIVSFGVMQYWKDYKRIHKRVL